MYKASLMIKAEERRRAAAKEANSQDLIRLSTEDTVSRLLLRKNIKKNIQAGNLVCGAAAAHTVHTHCAVKHLYCRAILHHRGVVTSLPHNM